MCAGSVHAFQMTRRGTATVRSSLRSSRSSAGYASLAMLFLLSLRVFAVQVRDVGLHAVEPGFPDCSLLRDPGFRRAQCGRFHLAGPDTADLRGANETAVLQYMEVLQKGGHGHGERLGELADGGRAPAQTRHDRPPSWIGQGVEDAVEVC